MSAAVDARALPPGWAWATLGELAADEPNALTIGPFGSDLKASDYRAQGVPLVFVREIRSGSFGDDRTKFIADEKASALRRHTVVGGDLLVTKMGDPPGDTAVYPIGRPAAVITADCIKLTPGVATTSLFLCLWLKSDVMRAAMQEESQGVAQQKLSLERFKAIRVPLPPLAEQRRIVAALDEMLGRVRAVRASLDEAPALLERARQAVLAAAFRGELTADWRAAHPAVEDAAALLARIRAERRRRWEEAERAKLTAKGKAPTDDRWKAKYEEPAPSSAPWAADLPATWVSTSLVEVTDPVRVIRYGILMPGPDVEDGVPYVKVRNIRNDRIDLAGIQRTTREIHEDFLGAELAEGDIVVAIRGTYGRVALVPRELHGGNVTQDSARVAPMSGVLSTCLAWMMRAPWIQKHWENVAKGVAVQGVNIADLRPTPIPLPPLDEQHEIVRRVEAALAKLDAVTAAVEATRTQLDAIERAVLAKAFRGELVAQDPADEPAEALLARLRAARAAGEKPAKRRGRSAG